MHTLARVVFIKYRQLGIWYASTCCSRLSLHLRLRLMISAGNFIILRNTQHATEELLPTPARL